MKIKYIAYGGEEFDTEKEYLEYEKEFDDFCIDCSNHIYCEDVDGKPIDLVHIIDIDYKKADPEGYSQFMKFLENWRPKT